MAGSVSTEKKLETTITTMLYVRRGTPSTSTREPSAQPN